MRSHLTAFPLSPFDHLACRRVMTGLMVRNLLQQISAYHVSPIDVPVSISIAFNIL